MTTKTMNRAPEEDAENRLSEAMDTFALELRSQGYTPITVAWKRTFISVFLRWARSHRVGLDDLDEAVVEAHLEDAPGSRTAAKIQRRRGILLQFLDHLRATNFIAPAPEAGACPMAAIKARYGDYLRRERGCATGTIDVYQRIADSFLSAVRPDESPSSLGDLTVEEVREFILDRVGRVAPSTVRSTAGSLRSFLRFLFVTGEVATDLSLAIPPVPCLRGRKPHPYLRPEEVERLLKACDATTAAGQRDHAVLLLLARLGLRAGEVVELELDDIRWRSSEIVVRGKDHAVDRLPLLSDIGEALALYLRETRGQCDSRCVFLKLHAPRTELVAASVTSIVRRALKRAGIETSFRGAHLLRYSLATTMIRQGASLTEIGEVLRHQSLGTTELYARVDFEGLRSIAKQWPNSGGSR